MKLKIKSKSLQKVKLFALPLEEKLNIKQKFAVFRDLNENRTWDCYQNSKNECH